MQKSSVKDVSVSDLEKVIAEAIGRLTGKEWEVCIADINFPAPSALDRAMPDGCEHLKLALSASEKTSLAWGAAAPDAP